MGTEVYVRSAEQAPAIRCSRGEVDARIVRAATPQNNITRRGSAAAREIDAGTQIEVAISEQDIMIRAAGGDGAVDRGCRRRRTAGAIRRDRRSALSPSSIRRHIARKSRMGPIARAGGRDDSRPRLRGACEGHRQGERKQEQERSSVNLQKQVLIVSGNSNVLSILSSAPKDRN